MGTVFLPQNSTTQRWGAAWTNAKDHCSGGGTYAYDSYFSEKYGCFLKWWYPLNTPKWSFVVGKPMVVGYHHFRKPPYGAENLLMFVRNPIYFSDIRRFAPCFFMNQRRLLLAGGAAGAVFKSFADTCNWSPSPASCMKIVEVAGFIPREFGAAVCNPNLW